MTKCWRNTYVRRDGSRWTGLPQPTREQADSIASKVEDNGNSARVYVVVCTLK